MTTTARLSAALDDRYRIERELGAGGMATVYLARDVKHDRLVALKVLRPDLAAVLGSERFLAEIRITAQLDHPHILTLIDSGAADGFLYYVLPYVRGESLRQKLTREKQLGVDEALAIARQIGGALDYAHRQGVVHRDIKPENILLQEGEAMLADFGIALAVREAGGNRLTQSGISLGTPQYMSPEQATGDRELDARSDVYSLGAVLYEMLAGEPPHTGPTVQAVIAKLLTERPTSVRLLRDTVPEGIERAVAKSLARVPADRFRSAGDFVAALRAPAPVARRVLFTRRTTLVAAVGVTTLAAVATAGVVLTRHRLKAPAPAYDHVRLTGTGHAHDPIVSPDGREVAYLDRQCSDARVCHSRIVVQDIATSAQRTFADSARGVTLERWSPSGSWLRLFASGTAGQPAGEYVVSSLGGPMTFLGLGFADFLPAGDSMLVTDEYLVTKPIHLRVVSLPGNRALTSVTIAPPHDASSIKEFAVAPNGRMVGIAWNRPHHAPTLAVYDRAGRLLDSTTVPDERVSGSLRWSTRSDALFLVFAYDQGHAQFRPAMYRIAVNAPSGHFGARDTLMIAAGEDGLGGYDLSATGQSLVYQSNRVGESTLWTLERPASGGQPRPIRRVQSSSVGLNGELSRNGHDIYYELPATAGGVPRIQLFTAPFDSGTGRAVTPLLAGVRSWEATLDGRRLIVETAQDNGHARLTAYDMATGRAAPFGPELPSDKYGTWPAGTDGIVLINTARDTLLVFDGNGHERRRIGIPDSLGSAQMSTPSPDASELAFLALPDNSESQMAEDGSWEVQLYRVSLATGQIRRFNRVRVLSFATGPFRWTTDGWIHMIMQPKGAPRELLYRVPLGGGAPELEGELPFAPDLCGCDMSGDGRRWVGIVAQYLSDIYLIRNFDPQRR